MMADRFAQQENGNAPLVAPRRYGDLILGFLSSLRADRLLCDRFVADQINQTQVCSPYAYALLLFPTH
jgi:hypothetical protein